MCLVTFLCTLSELEHIMGEKMSTHLKYRVNYYLLYHQFHCDFCEILIKGEVRAAQVRHYQSVIYDSKIYYCIKNRIKIFMPLQMRLKILILCWWGEILITIYSPSTLLKVWSAHIQRKVSDNLIRLDFVFLFVTKNCLLHFSAFGLIKW